MLTIVTTILILVLFLLIIKTIKMPNSFFENQRLREELYRLKLFREEENLEKRKIKNSKDTDHEEAN